MEHIQSELMGTELSPPDKSLPFPLQLLFLVARAALDVQSSKKIMTEWSDGVIPE